MSVTQQEKAARFRALHESGSPFVIPNPWDVASARIRLAAEAGVKRISLATSLCRAAMTGFLNAASDVKNSGQFGFVDSSVSTQELLKLMRA